MIAAAFGFPHKDTANHDQSAAKAAMPVPETTVTQHPQPTPLTDVAARYARVAATFATRSAREQLSAPPAARIALLRALFDFVDHHERDLCEAVRCDLGRDPAETAVHELAAVRCSLQYYVANIDRLTALHPSHERAFPFVLDPVVGYRRVPHGCCVIFGTWNFPVVLSLGPLAAALAAGNTVILKLHPSVPNTNAVFERHLLRYLSPDVIQLVHGDVDQNKALLALPFRHFFATSSVRFGSIVYAAAARHMAPCTLELGGKSPFIVDCLTADISITARRLMWGKTVNAGQVCLSPDYIVLVNYAQYAEKNSGKSFKDALIAECKAVLSAFYGDTWSSAPRAADGTLSRSLADYMDVFTNPVGDRIAQKVADSRIPDRYRSKFARLVNENQYNRAVSIIEQQLGNKNITIEIPGIITDPKTRLITPFVFSGYPSIREAPLQRDALRKKLEKESLSLAEAAVRDSTPQSDRPNGLPNFVEDEELFAPIIALIEAESKEAVVQYVSRSRTRHDPLVMYIFSTDKKFISFFEQEIDSGMVMVNDLMTNSVIEDIPFGGVSTSGLGCYHGEFGFDCFSRPKAIKIAPMWTDKLMEARYPNRLLSGSAATARFYMSVMRRFLDVSDRSGLVRYAGGGGGLRGLLSRMFGKQRLTALVVLVIAVAAAARVRGVF